MKTMAKDTLHSYVSLIRSALHHITFSKQLVWHLLIAKCFGKGACVGNCYSVKEGPKG